MTLKLITLDLDDTLWPVDATLKAAEGVFYRFLSEQEPALFENISPEDLRNHRLKVFEKDPRFKHNVSLWRRESLKQFLTSHKLSAKRVDELAAQAFAVFLEARQQVSLFEGAETVLAELASRYSLIALTNGNADIRKMAVGRFFNAAIRAEDIGVSKPAPDMFKRALAIANCRPQECLHIGDDPHYDIAPAQALGMHALRAAITGKFPVDENSFSHWQQVPRLITAIVSKEGGNKSALRY